MVIACLELAYLFFVQLFWKLLTRNFVGLFARLGALASLGISTQLYIGSANIPPPFEWEWTYGLMILLSMAILGVAAGRVFGADVGLRRKLAGPAKRGHRLARVGLLLS